MQFSKGTEVLYKGICGKIAFVGLEYITISIPPQQKQSARIVVYPEDYKQVYCLKDSEK